MTTTEPPTSHWNHRVMRRIYEDGSVAYQIHEVYYEDGKPWMSTVDAIAPYGDTIEDLRWCLEAMLRALDAPVLDYETREEIENEQST